MAGGTTREDFVPLDAAEGHIDFSEINGGRILSGLIEAGRKQLADERENYLAHTVNGTGDGVAKLRDVIERKIGPEAYDPSAIIRQDANKNVKGMLNWAVASDCKRFAEGKATDTIFYKDLIRGMIVNLPGGKQLSNDFATACNEIAQFVTGNTNATYATLDAKAKGMVHIVMSLLSQETMKAATDGITVALDKDKAQPAFNMAFVQDMRNRVFTLDLTPGGGLYVNFESNMDVRVITTMYDDETIMPGEGSKLSSKFLLQIVPEEFERLAEVDFTQFDSQGAQNVFNSSDKDKVTTTIDSFAPQFKFDPKKTSCDTMFSVTVN